MPGDRRDRRIELSAIRIQSFVAVLALMLSVPGLWVGVIAFREQQRINKSQLEINRSQSELNRLEMRRFERRYASRVVYWDEKTEDGSVINLQNRSLVPITDLTLNFIVPWHYGSSMPDDKDGTATLQVLIEAVPPCIHLRVPVRHAQVRFLTDTARVEIEHGRNVEWITDAISFADPSGSWGLRGSSLAKLDQEFDYVGDRDIPMSLVRVLQPHYHVESLRLLRIWRGHLGAPDEGRYGAEDLGGEGLAEPTLTPLSDCGESN